MKTDAKENQAGAQAQAAPKHTPGPWIARHDATSRSAVWSITDELGYHVANIRGDSGASHFKAEVANAKLIASAPDLAAENERVRAELAETKAQRDALLEDMNQIAMRANFMLVRDPMNNQADYILQQAKAAMARCEEEEKAEAGK